MQCLLRDLSGPFLGLALAACTRHGAQVFSGDPARDLPSSAKVALPPGRELLGYSWNGGARVPWLSPGAPAAFPLGEFGRTPCTLFYLTFDHPRAAELALTPGAPGGCKPLERGCRSAPGRYGQGLELASDSLFSLELPEAARAERAWTIELWLYPEQVRNRMLLDLPGMLSVRTSGTGRIVAEFSSEPPQRTASQGDLRAGEWNHLGVVLDLLDTRSLRVFLNGTLWSQPIGSLQGARSPSVLRLGDLAGQGLGLAGRYDELSLSIRAANTREFEEHAAAAWAGGREELRLFFADGVLDLELWADPLREPVLDSPEEWLQGRLEHALPLADGLTWTEGNWRRIEALDPPTARTTHPTVFVGGHQILVFGGETRDTHLSPMWNTGDTWLFDTVQETWTRLATPQAPPGRCHQAAAYSPDHDLLLMAGGWQNDKQKKRRALNDTWVFHVGERRWEWRQPAGERTGALSDSVVIYHPGLRRFLVIHVGRILLYDPEQDRWEGRPQASAVDQDGRPVDYVPWGSTIAGVDPRTGLVLLFGGGRQTEEGGEEFSDSTALFDVQANRYTVLAPKQAPSPRVRAAMAWDVRHERFVLFGGVQDQYSEREADLWTFSPDTRHWSQLQAANPPSARGGYYGMAYDPELARFFVLCGRHSPMRFLDEAWTLALEPAAVGCARVVFDRDGFEQHEWFAQCETPGDSRVDLRFRASGDGLAWSDWSDAPPPEGAGTRYLQVEVRLHPGSAGQAPRVRALGFR
jgi:hypothetical protein